MSTRNEQHEAILNANLDIAYLKRIETYKKTEVAWFFSKKDNNWELSNMAGQMPLKFDKKRWNSSEQLYQASKYGSNVECIPSARIGDDKVVKNVRDRIFSQTAARGAKMTQKCAVKAGLVRSDWNDPDWEVRIHSMLWVLELKLDRNRLTFGQLLKSTAGKHIVEVSRKDAFWGCKVEGEVLKGCNVLGKLLEIQLDRYDEIKKGNYLYPKGFLLT